MASESAELNKAIAYILAGTKTHKRSISLADFYGWLKIAIHELEDVNLVAERVGLSVRMIKQFLAYEHLEKRVQRLVKERRIDSVDVINYLAQFNTVEQGVIAEYLVKRAINSQDVRSIYQQRKLLPKMPIAEVIERVRKGKTTKIYIIEFVVREGLTKQKVINSLSPIVGKENLNEVCITKPIGRVGLTALGLDLLRNYGRNENISPKTLIPRLLYS